MPLLIALAVSIGALAVLATWLFLVPLAALGVQIWQAFVAWASHYPSGGKLPDARNTAVCMSFGAVVGALSVMLAGQLGGLGGLRLRVRGPGRPAHQAALKARLSPHAPQAAAVLKPGRVASRCRLRRGRAAGW